MSFDALSAAEALADYELAFYLLPREPIILQIDPGFNTIGFSDLVNSIWSFIVKTDGLKSLKKVVQLQMQQQVLLGYWP